MSAAIKVLVIAALAVASWALLAGYAVLWGASPLTATLLLSHGTAFMAGLWWRDRRREALAVVSDWHDEEIDAIKLADTQSDKRVITGEHPTVEPETWAMDGTVIPAMYAPRCDNCGHSATHVNKADASDFVCLDCLKDYWPDLLGTTYVLIGGDDFPPFAVETARCDDDSSAFLPRSVPDPWKSAARGERQ